MKASPIITSMNAGEMSPLLHGRSDLAKYSSGCALMQNFVPRVQGPMTRRDGSHYVSAVKDSADRGWLLRFEFSATQAWVLEFGDGCVRFYLNRAQVLVSGVAAWATTTAYEIGDLVLQSGTNYYCQEAHTSGTFATDLAAGKWYALTGSVYEIPSPYAIADLTNADGTCALKVTQSGDVLYIANQTRTYKPQTLTRYGATDWVFADYEPANGPFLEENTTDITIDVSAASGTKTLTASEALFASTDVGRLIRVAPINNSVKPWETGKSYTANTSTVKYDGKVYVARTTATSGTSPPIHEGGKAYDGDSGVEWEYQHSGYGVLRIVGYTSPTVVTADAVSDASAGLAEIPGGMSSPNETTKWSLGAWSDTTEYPSSVTFWGERLWWAGKQRVWGSVPSDYENMAGDFFGQTTADCAIWAILAAQEVLWLAGDTVLIIGTIDGEFIGREITTSSAIGPGNFTIKRHGKRRCRAVAPLEIGERLVFVQRSGRRLYEMGYSFESDRFGSTDLAVLAERMTRDGIIDMAYGAEPFSAIWCVLATGKLLGFTYDQGQEVTGWHRQPIGGDAIIESVVTIPSPDGLGDDLWFIARRTIDGATVRYVEWIGRPWEGEDNDGTAGDAQEDAFFVDSGLTYDGAPADVISGLDHLEGETVDILADGAAHPQRTVSGGSITLDAEYSVVHVGLPFVSRYVSNDIEAGGTAGTGQGKVGRVYKVDVRFIDTLGGKVGRPGIDFRDASDSVLETISQRFPSDPMGQPPPIRSSMRSIDFPGDWELEKRIEIVQDQPLPMTVGSIMPRMHVNDR